MELWILALFLLPLSGLGIILNPAPATVFQTKDDPFEVADRYTILGNESLVLNARNPPAYDEERRYDGSFMPLTMIKKSSVNKSSDVVLFMSTSLSDQHMSFLECWPSRILSRSKLLAEADIILHTFRIDDPDALVRLTDTLATFPNQVIKLAHMAKANPGRFGPSNAGFVGKQWGANKAVFDAFLHGWVKPYEWMIRLQPDVFVWSDTRLAGAMKNPSTWGIFANCP